MKKQIKLWLVFHFSLYVILLAPKAFKKFISYHFSILSCNLYVSGQDIHLEDLLQLYFFPSMQHWLKVKKLLSLILNSIFACRHL